MSLSLCVLGKDRCSCLAVVTAAVIAALAASLFSTSGEVSNTSNSLAKVSIAKKCYYLALRGKRCLQRVCYYILIMGVFWAAGVAFLVCTVGGL